MQTHVMTRPETLIDVDLISPDLVSGPVGTPGEQMPPHLRARWYWRRCHTVTPATCAASALCHQRTTLLLTDGDDYGGQRDQQGLEHVCLLTLLS